MEQTQENIHKLYGNFGDGFFNKYGGSFFLSILVFITIVVLVVYINMKVNIVKIKDNWNNLKCDPRYAAFSGMVVPEEGKTLFESGTENVQHCFNTVLKEVSDQSLSPLYFIINNLKSVANETSDFINSSRKISSNVRNSLNSIFGDVFSRLINVMVPFQSMVVNLKDIFSKMKTTLLTSMYPLLGMYYVLKSSIDLMYKIIVKILIGLAATIVVLWIFPFTWGAAAAMTSIFLMIMTPMLIMAVIMGDVFHLSHKKLPKKPHKRHCFNGDFIIQTQRGEIPISELKPNDIVKGNVRVTSVMKLSRNDELLYDLGNGLYVSGTHKIYNERLKDFIYVFRDGRFKKAKHRNDEFLYCFNTTNKLIQMNGYVFLDYDELTNDYLTDIIMHFKTTFPTMVFNKSSLHNTYDGGFSHETPILMSDISLKMLSEIEIGDTLWGDIEVLGIVTIQPNTTRTFSVKVNKTSIKDCNRNIVFENTATREKESTLNYKKNKHDSFTQTSEKYKIHLLTNTGFFYLKNMKIYDYNACLEYFFGNTGYEKSSV